MQNSLPIEQILENQVTACSIALVLFVINQAIIYALNLYYKSHKDTIKIKTSALPIINVDKAGYRLKNFLIPSAIMIMCLGLFVFEAKMLGDWSLFAPAVGGLIFYLGYSIITSIQALYSLHYQDKYITGEAVIDLRWSIKQKASHILMYAILLFAVGLLYKSEYLLIAGLSNSIASLIFWYKSGKIK